VYVILFLVKSSKRVFLSSFSLYRTDIRFVMLSMVLLLRIALFPLKRASISSVLRILKFFGLSKNTWASGWAKTIAPSTQVLIPL